MSHPQRIGVLTGGGDCPGLNAVIRAVTKDALHHGIEVMGIEDGFLGLIEDRIRPLHDADVSNILHHGGTVLGSSNKANPSKFATGKNPDGSVIFEDLTKECVQRLQHYGIKALVVIGGDGTMSAASRVAKLGVNCIGVPKTIDNDLWGTDITFGFSTAVQTATDAIDRVRTTAASHHRVMAVEVMGRNAGWLALHSGLASAADVILIPEIPFHIDAICHRIRERLALGKRYTILCCAEGASPAGGKQMIERIDPTSPDPIRLGGIGKWVADQIEEHTGIESRYVVLGHVQRGGTPVAVDRVLATLFGDHAMHLLLNGERNRLVVRRDGRFTDIPIEEAANKQRLVDLNDPAMEAARSVGTTFGEAI